jgi:uncharacterized protein YbjT (DUF2867 family)
MKIVVFGGTGGTGKNVVALAAAEGHEVVAIARRPEAVAARAGLTVHKGDVLDPATFSAHLAGAGAVICAIGPAKNSQPGTLISQGAKHVSAACAAAGVKRLVFESGMMVGDGSELSWFGRLSIRAAQLFLGKLYRDKALAEATVRGSGLDWVIVRPPVLDHSAATGDYLAAPRARISPAKAISHADCAAVLLRAATGPEWVGKVVNVGRA